MSNGRLTDEDREALRAVFAGWSTMPADLTPAVEQIVARHVEPLAYKYASFVDCERACCHSEEELRAGGRTDDDEFEPVPDDCVGTQILREQGWLP